MGDFFSFYFRFLRSNIKKIIAFEGVSDLELKMEIYRI